MANRKTKRLFDWCHGRKPSEPVPLEVLDRIATARPVWDFDKLIVAHGVCIEKDARPFVELAFRWLVC